MASYVLPASRAGGRSVVSTPSGTGLTYPSSGVGFVQDSGTYVPITTTAQLTLTAAETWTSLTVVAPNTYLIANVGIIGQSPGAYVLSASRAGLRSVVSRTLIPPPTTQVQLTVEALEEWATPDVFGQLTSTASEHWATVSTVPTIAAVTQFALEEWTGVAIVTSTTGRLTQAVLEEWMHPLSYAQLTSEAAEIWATTLTVSVTPTQAQLTQVVVEEWPIPPPPPVQMTQIVLEEWSNIPFSTAIDGWFWVYTL